MHRTARSFVSEHWWSAGKGFRLPRDWSDSALGAVRRCIRVRLSKNVDYLIDNLFINTISEMKEGDQRESEGSGVGSQIWKWIGVGKSSGTVPSVPVSPSPKACVRPR